VKFLIAGLGNIGDEYAHTRHNIGFDVLDKFAVKHNVEFKTDRLAFYSLVKIKGKAFHLIKPTTYMNLSGKSVLYWMNKLEIPAENLLVVVDELALPFGTIRMRKKGSDGGHNGLADIQTSIETTEYPRLRFGIGNDFPKGLQVNYVLSKWEKSQEKELNVLIDKSIEAITDFGLMGLDKAMNKYN